MPEVIARIPVLVVEKRTVKTDGDSAERAKPHHRHGNRSDRLRKKLPEASPLCEEARPYEEQKEIKQLDPEEEAGRNGALRFHRGVTITELPPRRQPSFASSNRSEAQTSHRSRSVSKKKKSSCALRSYVHSLKRVRTSSE